jgi:hypothetical protein
MGQQKTEIELLQIRADHALGLFNLLKTIPHTDNLQIGFSKGGEFKAVAIPKNKKLREGLQTFIQQICEYHITGKMKLVGGEKSVNQFPDIPEWFAHYFAFCSEIGCNPFPSDVPKIEKQYTFQRLKNGSIIVVFEEKVKYKDYVSKNWRATKSGTFEKL